MKLKLIILSLLALNFTCESSRPSNTIPKSSGSNTSTWLASTYASSITNTDLKQLLYTYASDEFAGRGTGEQGQKLAVNFLKNSYKTIGVESPLSKDDYFQEVPLRKQKALEAQITVNNKVFNTFESHLVIRLGKDIRLSTDNIVYVGYGIDTDNYSDYKNIDVDGKIVLAKAGEPKDKEGNYITSGGSTDTKWTDKNESIISKREAAKANGAKALLYFDDAIFKRYAPSYKRQINQPGRLALKSSDNLSLIIINDELANTLLPNIDEDTTPKTMSTTISIEALDNNLDVDAENVVAYIKGSEKPDELIIISAHLDHLGKDGEDIYNGADDDGSGTVALLEIAEAFAKAKKDGNGPKRSLLFLHVTAEEKGLLGSQYYTDVDPIFPLKQTIANLNIDMIGRTDPKRTQGSRNYVYLIGSDKLSTELHNISEAVNTKYTNLELDYKYNDDNDPNRFYYRSDHYNFAKNNIPVIFYFNGTHKDYHKTTDTPDKIEYDLLQKRTRLIFYTAWELANREDRLIVDKASDN